MCAVTDVACMSWITHVASYLWTVSISLLVAGSGHMGTRNSVWARRLLRCTPRTGAKPLGGTWFNCILHYTGLSVQFCLLMNLRNSAVFLDGRGGARLTNLNGFKCCWWQFVFFLRQPTQYVSLALVLDFKRDWTSCSYLEKRLTYFCSNTDSLLEQDCRARWLSAFKSSFLHYLNWTSTQGGSCMFSAFCLTASSFSQLFMWLFHLVWDRKTSFQRRDYRVPERVA